MASKSKYLILCANVAHPLGDLKYFLLEDDDENTVEFNSMADAGRWCEEHPSGLLAYVILCTDDFSYE